jgi:hypothetical protein
VILTKLNCVIGALRHSKGGSVTDFERRELTVETGETVTVTRFDDDTVAVRIAGKIEYAGSVEQAGVIVGALIESDLFKDE